MCVRFFSSSFALSFSLQLARNIEEKTMNVWQIHIEKKTVTKHISSCGKVVAPPFNFFKCTMTWDCDFMNFEFICCIFSYSCQCHQLNLRDRETRISAHVTHKLCKTHTHEHIRIGVSVGGIFFYCIVWFGFNAESHCNFVLAVVTSLQLLILIFPGAGIVFCFIFNVYSIKQIGLNQCFEWKVVFVSFFFVSFWWYKSHNLST